LTGAGGNQGVNEVVVWDKIVQRKDSRKIKVTKQDLKYIFYDPFFTLG